VRKADNLPPSCAVVTQSGKLNFSEPSGPLQACTGLLYPFYNDKTKLTKLKRGENDLVIIQTYMPTSDYKDEEVEVY